MWQTCDNMLMVLCYIVVNVTCIIIVILGCVCVCVCVCVLLVTLNKINFRHLQNWLFNASSFLEIRINCSSCGVKLGPLHTQDREPVSIILQALSLVEKAELVQVRFTLCLRDQRKMWMQDGCKVHMDFYMASNGSWFMVTWTILKNHFLEVGLTQNWVITALRTLATVGLLYFIMCEDPHE
jgi:hypothetical protein